MPSSGTLDLSAEYLSDDNGAAVNAGNSKKKLIVKKNMNYVTI